jgi:hypothetical protein
MPMRSPDGDALDLKPGATPGQLAAGVGDDDVRTT